jgi:hypothetical protein
MMHTYQLPLGFAVTFRISPRGFETAWDPHVPTGQTASRLLPAYRNARDHFLGGLGFDVVVIEQ